MYFIYLMTTKIDNLFCKIVIKCMKFTAQLDGSYRLRVHMILSVNLCSLIVSIKYNWKDRWRRLHNYVDSSSIANPCSIIILMYKT